MKILLIRPPVPKYTIGLKHIMICEPLELEYVAAGLEYHEVKIIDLILEKNFLKKLEKFNPDVIGTSSYINGVNEVIKICRIVKNWKPNCLTVVGGVHASIVPEDFADTSINIVVLGDGTTKFREIVEQFYLGLPFDTIAGLAIVKGKNKIFMTAKSDYMIDPDKLPFPRRDLLSHLNHKYYYLFHQPVTLMKTTWGCWYKCNFCFNWKVTCGTPYTRSPESIVKEIETIPTNDVYIVDDIFLINSKRLLHIADLIKQKNINKKYLVYSRADFICENEDVIKIWSEIGLSAVIVGLEATTDPELDSMNKQCTVDYNRKAIRILRRYGIDTYASLIPLPNYSKADWDRLLNFIFENGLYYVNISPLTPMPGTDIWEVYKDQIIISTKAHSLWDLSHTVLPTKMDLKDFYKNLLRVYSKTILDVNRASKLTLRTRPPIFSITYIRLLSGAFRIAFQFLTCHRHHLPRSIAKAEYEGPEIKQVSMPIYSSSKTGIN